MYQDIVEKGKTLAVIGLGYVGLPIALEFAKKIKVIGFDINQSRIELMKQGIDPSNELCSADFAGTDITFTNSLDVLRQASFFIVAVPTPIDRHNLPDLTPLLKATETVGKCLKKGDYVVYESTVYPGCTEEDCLPVLERLSGLKLGTDFKLGYSPERINPGDKEHTLRKIIKVASGSDAEAADVIARVYELVVDAGVHRASCIRVAEAAKIIENTQRDVNIALMNELSMIFGKMGINTYEVLEAAGTKWNFLRFVPGLVGGHCIGVDPYYLTHKAQELGHHARMITAGRSINDGMGSYIARQIVKRIIQSGKPLLGARILMMGITFKENVSDIRNSKVADVYHELKEFGLEIDVIDPHAEASEVSHEYGIAMKSAASGQYNAVLLAVGHKEYLSLDAAKLEALLVPGGLIADIKGLLREKFAGAQNYWTL